ncbi:MAG: hypothetical protein HUU02_00990 [Bacteroidetes bacterium]|nr:hypothetical protein [Bacteroidota bacterium]
MIRTRSNGAVFMLSILSILFSSCMHSIMMGGHSGHDEGQAVSIIKETSTNGHTLSVTVPAMTVQKEALILIALRSVSTLPDSAMVHVMITASDADHPSSHEDHNGMVNAQEFQPVHQNVAIRNGSGTFPYTPTAAGRFTLTASSTIDSVALRSEINVTVSATKGRGMMGMGSGWDYPIIGGILMGTMMILRWVI